jgi:hypothetical protein
LVKVSAGEEEGLVVAAVARRHRWQTKRMQNAKQAMKDATGGARFSFCIPCFAFCIFAIGRSMMQPRWLDHSPRFGPPLALPHKLTLPYPTHTIRRDCSPTRWTPAPLHDAREFPRHNSRGNE